MIRYRSRSEWGAIVILSVAKEPELECSSNGRLPRFAKPALSETGSAQAVGKSKPRPRSRRSSIEEVNLQSFQRITAVSQSTRRRVTYPDECEERPLDN
jgi:hypothetical protein